MRTGFNARPVLKYLLNNILNSEFIQLHSTKGKKDKVAPVLN
jgi:hypothetical protein